MNKFYWQMAYRSLANDIPQELIQAMADDSKDWAQVNGVCMRLTDQKGKSDLTQILPFTLVPSVMPRKLFEEAYAVQQDLNVLYHKIAFDQKFLETCLRCVLPSDTFTRNLYDIYKKTYTNENCLSKIQPIVLTIQRSDYMFHNPSVGQIRDNSNGTQSGLNTYLLKQVEVNNIAAGGAGLADRVTKMHKRSIQQWSYIDPSYAMSNIPENGSLKLVSKALADAWLCYNIPESILLVVIEEENQNAMDQRMVEHDFSLLTGCQVRRMTLSEISTTAKVDYNRDQRLMIKTSADQNPLEVAVVYFRSGYLPQHYPSESEWRARLEIERSAAIKCPWIGAHLAGTKKVQQVLTKTDLVAMFDLSPDSEFRIKRTFAGLFGLDADDPATDQIKSIAEQHPESFVLKPQLEGGGNNTYGIELAEKLKTLTPQKLESYILMEKLNPLVHENILVRANQPLTLTKVDSELGVFGYVLGDKTNLHKQGHFGHIVRTKPVHFDEGGISTGKAAHDAPFLV